MKTLLMVVFAIASVASAKEYTLMCPPGGATNVEPCIAYPKNAFPAIATSNVQAQPQKCYGGDPVVEYTCPTAGNANFLIRLSNWFKKHGFVEVQVVEHPASGN